MKLNKMQTEYVILQKKKHPNTPHSLPPPLKKGFYLKYHHEIAHIHHKISVLLDVSDYTRVFECIRTEL